ncbi:MAG: hypothetical protein BZY88_10715 [SAR202 cluster bacterium Io17-Chloro-G9]|nr:MAG: hypothetical protein BZY88_10715 [SAR202 cluster bacterium Io17-Chloro-G9]
MPEIYQPTIRELPKGERPRERLREYGPRHLNNSELIAILLRTGMQGENVLALASRILARFNGLAGLGKAGFVELCSQRGLSEAKACQLLAALELGKRLVSLAPQERVPLNSPEDVANLISAEMSSLEQEHLRVLLLNTRHELLGIREIYSGNVSSAVVRVAEVFRPAIRDNAPFIIVAHNHPSGDPAPSEDDVKVTRDLVAAGKLLGVEVLDHVVIGDGNRFVSLNQKGLGFD